MTTESGNQAASTFDRAIEMTEQVIDGMPDKKQAEQRRLLVRLIKLTWDLRRQSPGDTLENSPSALLDASGTIRDYAVDMRLAILAAALHFPDVLMYITEGFRGRINPENTSDSERAAREILQAPNLVGNWELFSTKTGGWRLQLVTTNSTQRPELGSLLVR